jgi:hypothetical protein
MLEVTLQNYIQIGSCSWAGMDFLNNYRIARFVKEETA